MAERLTKRKIEGGWRVVADGRDTPLYIVKGDPPRYREPQMYCCCIDREGMDFLFEAAGVGLVMSRLETLASALLPA